MSDKAYLKLMKQKLNEQFDLSESESEVETVEEAIQSEIKGEVPELLSDSETEMIPNKQVPVVVFETKVSKSVNNIASYSEFMSSKINKKKSIAKQEVIKDDLNKEDKELDDILQASKLVEQFNAESLQGKERHDYLKSKLGFKEPKVSLPIFKGMKKAAEKRVTKKVQDLKNLGLYNATNKRQVIQKERTLRDIDKKKVEKKDHGLVGSLGTYKPGVLSVPKQLIENVQKNKRKSRKH